MMAWANSRAGERRAYAVPLDDALRNRALPVEITPEGTRVYTPTLLPVADRFLMAYWDSKGAAAGVYLRWLGPNAVIGSAPIAVTSKKPGAYFAAATRAADGGFVVAFADRLEADSVDLFFRSFDQAGNPVAEVVRASDYLNRGAAPSRVNKVRVELGGDKLHFAFSFVQGSMQQIRYMAVPANSGPPGLEPLQPGKREERLLGEEIEISPSNVRADDPSLACVKVGCFIAWHQLGIGGAGVAFVDAKTGKRRWFKVITTKGKRPALGVAPSGDVQIVWIEGGRLTTATLGVEGVGPLSKVARVVGNHRSPMIAPGMKRGEWYISWLDYEAGHREPYAVRMQCQ